MKRNLALFFAAAALCILSACGANEAAPAAVITTEAPSPSPEMTPAPAPAPTATPAPIDVYGVEAAWDTAEVDFHDVKIEDAGAALTDAIPSLPRLRRVDMTGCGLTDEEMGALQETFPDISFSWPVCIYTFRTMSDTDYFITNPDAGVELTGVQHGPSALRYCRDLVALDLGHCHLDSAPFVAGMPHLKYLILADNPIYDLSPLADLKELEWLELFNTNLWDLSPLVGCTALRDLNICYIPASGEAIVKTLSQMPWLRRVWCSGANLSYAEIDELRAALPDTEIWCPAGDESSGGTWRYDEDYYEMRDAFHMYYMDIDGDPIERMTPDELAAVHKKYWGY